MNGISLLDEKLYALGFRSERGYEIIAVGGFIFVSYYQSRMSSQDIDIVSNIPVSIFNEIREVGLILGTTSDWMNNDFMRSPSYTPAVYKYKTFLAEYKSFKLYIADERLVLCMKLMSWRSRAGKYDKEDAKVIIGSLARRGVVVDRNSLYIWFTEFYTNYGIKIRIPQTAKNFINNL